MSGWWAVVEFALAVFGLWALGTILFVFAWIYLTRRSDEGWERRLDDLTEPNRTVHLHERRRAR